MVSNRSGQARSRHPQSLSPVATFPILRPLPTSTRSGHRNFLQRPLEFLPTNRIPLNQRSAPLFPLAPLLSTFHLHLHITQMTSTCLQIEITHPSILHTSHHTISQPNLPTLSLTSTPPSNHQLLLNNLHQCDRPVSLMHNTLCIPTG